MKLKTKAPLGGGATRAAGQPNSLPRSIADKPPQVKEKVKVYFTKENGRKVQVGVVEGDTFKRRAKGSRHMLRNPRGWAFAIETLAELERRGVKVVEVEDVETGVHYSAGLAQVWSLGRDINYGYGQQKCLPLSCWKTQQPAQMRMFPSQSAMQMSDRMSLLTSATTVGLA